MEEKFRKKRKKVGGERGAETEEEPSHSTSGGNGLLGGFCLKKKQNLTVTLSHDKLSKLTGFVTRVSLHAILYNSLGRRPSYYTRGKFHLNREKSSRDTINH